MNNVKAANALLSLSDAFTNTVGEYETTIANLHRENKSLTERLARASLLEQQLLKTERVVQDAHLLVIRATTKISSSSWESFGQLRQDADSVRLVLEQAPCLKNPSRSESPGRPKDFPTSAASTPSESLT